MAEVAPAGVRRINNCSNDFIVQSFAPIHAMSEWQNEDCMRVFSVAILLPSGLNDKNHSKVGVTDCGSKLEVKIMWPQMLTDVSLLHVCWNRISATIPMSHPKIVGFHSFFKTLCKRDADQIFSVGHVDLPALVNKVIKSITRIGDRNGTRIVCVELAASETANYLDKDKEDCHVA